jgi:hypothetical protein
VLKWEQALEEGKGEQVRSRFKVKVESQKEFTITITIKWCVISMWSMHAKKGNCFCCSFVGSRGKI